MTAAESLMVSDGSDVSRAVFGAEMGYRDPGEDGMWLRKRGI